VEWALLKGLAEEEVRQVLTRAHRRRFARREVLFHEGDPASSMHMLAKGRVAVRVSTPLGDIATLDVFLPGDVFGEMALLSPDAVRSATAIAMEPTETLVIDEPVFSQLRRQYPSVSDVLVQVLGARLRRLNERYLEALYVPADVRVMRRLLEVADTYGEAVLLTQEDLAALAGTSRATVNRVLRDEEKRGALVLSRGRVRILDRDELTRRARRPIPR
jgi:CRP/FNR family cyclic AMP-dependent transcriptional regulator